MWRDQVYAVWELDWRLNGHLEQVCQPVLPQPVWSHQNKHGLWHLNLELPWESEELVGRFLCRRKVSAGDPGLRPPLQNMVNDCLPRRSAVLLLTPVTPFWWYCLQKSMAFRQGQEERALVGSAWLSYCLWKLANSKNHFFYSSKCRISFHLFWGGSAGNSLDSYNILRFWPGNKAMFKCSNWMKLK